MIKTERGKTLIQGSQAEVGADLRCLIQSTFFAFQKRMSTEEAEKEIRKAVEDALNAPQEDNIAIEDIVENVLEEILQTIRKGKGDK